MSDISELIFDPEGEEVFDAGDPEPIPDTGHTRKEFVARGATAVGALSLASLVGAGSARAAAQSTSAPVRGGRLTIGMVGSGQSETLNPNLSANEIDDLRNFSLFEGMTRLSADGKKAFPAIAADLQPNAQGTVWRARLADVVFHNGKRLTADDVVYSFRYVLDPKNGSQGRPLIASFLDPSGVRRIDKTTVEFRLKLPYFYFPFTLREQRVRIVPAGTKSFDPPIGTGLFKFRSWTPGQRSLFVRHDEYRGRPAYMAELETIAINDASARLNALKAGQINALGLLDATQIAAVRTDPKLKLLKSRGGNGVRFVMDVTRPPFNDPRVRQAFRYMIDREQMLKTAYLGEGTIGNDLEAPFDADYARSIPQRTYDPERAKSLLKAAGRDGLEITLNTGEIAPGAVEMSVLWAQQAKAAGVKMKVKKWPADQYWSGPYMKTPLFLTEWSGRPLVPQYFMATFSAAPYNETNWKRPGFDKMVLRAISAKNAARRRELLAEVQKLLYDEGGYIIPVYRRNIDAVSAKVTGIVPSVHRPLGAYHWLNTYIKK